MADDAIIMAVMHYIGTNINRLLVFDGPVETQTGKTTIMTHGIWVGTLPIIICFCGWSDKLEFLK